MLVESEETPTTVNKLHGVKDKLEEWGMKVNCMAEDNSDEGLKESMRLPLSKWIWQECGASSEEDEVASLYWLVVMWLHW